MKMKVSNKFFWIICALYLGNEVKAKIRGIAGIDFPNYSTVPKTSFKCSEQQFNPGFYADVETRCQVFHYCYNHRKESFLCPPGTIYNQPIRSCDYWYSSECDSAPSFYHMNALNEDKNLIDDFMFASAKTSTNNVFEKMAALYEPKEKSEDFMYTANDQSLTIGEHRTGFILENNGKNYITHSDKAQYENVLFTERPADELLNDFNKINLEDINAEEFNQNKNSIQDNIVFNDKQHETEDFDYSGFGDTVDFSLHNNPENTWIEGKDHSYKIDTYVDFSSEEMSKIDFNEEQLSDDTMNNNPPYEEQFSSQIELTKRFSQTELNPKINRLRRRPKYVVIQSDEIIPSLEKENYNVKNIYTYENTFKDKSNTSVSYETVSFKNSTDSHEMDKSSVKLLPGKPKRTRRPLIILPDNIQTTVSPSKEYIPAMPNNIFDTYLPDDTVGKPPLKRKPIFIHDMNEKVNSSINLYSATMIPLEASSSDTIYTIDDSTEDISQLYNFLLSTELPTYETTTIPNLSEFSTVADKSLRKQEQDLFHNENTSRENFQKTEIDIVPSYQQEIVEQEFQQDHLNSTENEVIAIQTDFENKYHGMGLNDFELSESNSKNMKESNLRYPEFKDSSTFSLVELDELTSTQSEYSTYDLNANLKEKWSEISDKSTLEHKDMQVNNQPGNFFSEILTNFTDETNHDYNEQINDEILNSNTESPVEYTKFINEDLFETHYNSQWIDERYFEISDKSTLVDNDILVNNQSGNLFSEIQTNLTDEVNNDYNEQINDEIINANTASPVEYTESINEQDLFKTHDNSQWIDENEFLSLLEMNSGVINDNTNIVYHEFDGNGGLEKIDYDEKKSEVPDKYQFEDLNGNLNTEGTPYIEQEFYTDASSHPFYIREDTDENLGFLQESETNDDISTAFPLDLESVEHSLNEEFIPKSVISQSVTPNIPVHLNPTKIRQKLKEKSSKNSSSQTNEDRRIEDLLIATKENLFEGELGNKVNASEFNTDDSVNQSIFQVPINFGLEDSHLKNIVDSEIGNEVMIQEIFEPNSITDINPLPGTAVKEELFEISQINPTFKVKGIKTNAAMEQSTIGKKEFQQNSQFVSSSTNVPIVDKSLSKPQLLSNSIKVPISTTTNLLKPHFPSNDVKISISGKNVLTAVKEELFEISQINPTFKEKDIETNVAMEQSTIGKEEFQQNSLFVSSSTNVPIVDKSFSKPQLLSSSIKVPIPDKLLKPQFPSNDVKIPIADKSLSKPQLLPNSIKVPISTTTNLLKPKFPSNDVKIPISGKNVQEFQFPSRSKKSLTKTVGKSQFTSLPPLRNMQMLLSTYLSDSGVNDRSLFSSRSGKLFKSEKFAKAITFGKKLLAMKRAKFNILKKYVASFSNEN